VLALLLPSYPFEFGTNFHHNMWNNVVVLKKNCMFLPCMWPMDSTKAWKPFFFAFTKFLWAVEPFIQSLVLLTCWPHPLANLVKSFNGTNDYAFRQTSLFAFGGQNLCDYIPGIHWTCDKNVVVTFSIVGLSILAFFYWCIVDTLRSNIDVEIIMIHFIMMCGNYGWCWRVVLCYASVLNIEHYVSWFWIAIDEWIEIILDQKVVIV